LLGEEKLKLGFWGIVKWITKEMKDCGRVYLGIGEPAPIKNMYN